MSIILDLDLDPLVTEATFEHRHSGDGPSDLRFEEDAPDSRVSVSVTRIPTDFRSPFECRFTAHLNGHLTHLRRAKVSMRRATLPEYLTRVVDSLRNGTIPEHARDSVIRVSPEFYALATARTLPKAWKD